MSHSLRTCVTIVVLLPVFSTAGALANSQDEIQVEDKESHRREAEETAFTWVFGDDRTIDKRPRIDKEREFLETRLLSKLAFVDQLCKINDQQLQKLLLAGRHDNERFLDRVRELATKVEQAGEDAAALTKLKDEADKLGQALNSPESGRRLFGPKESNSLFFKSLKTSLTAEQGAKFQAVSAILGAGGKYRTQSIGGEEGYTIALANTPFADDDLEQAVLLPGILSLVLTGTKVTDAGMLHLKGQRRLVSLSLGKTQVTDAGLAHLEGFANLNLLTIDDTQVTDAGMEHVKSLTALRYLALNSKVTDAGLEQLQAMKLLKSLSLNGTQITDEGLEHLRNMPDLEYLYLEDTAVTDAGLKHLQNNPRLRNVSLKNTRITDAGLEQLKGLPDLRSLFLGGTDVTDDGIADLQKSSPLLQVFKGE